MASRNSKAQIYHQVPEVDNASDMFDDGGIPNMRETRILSDERLKQPEPPRYIFRQSNSRRINWDLFVMVLAMWNCFSIPFVLCFEISDDDLTVVSAVDILIDILFAVDIVVVFNTTFINSKSGEEVFDRKSIAKNYISSPRFAVDVLATIPVDSIAEASGSSSSIFALFGLLKLIRILRLSKIILNMRVMERIKIYMKLVQLMLMVLMYLHLGSCIWHIIVMRDTDWFPSTNIIIGDKLYYSSGVWYQYFLSFYTSVSMLVGIEIMPQNTTQVAYSCVMILLGAMISALMFGQMVILVTALNAKATEFNELITTANTTMNNMKLNSDLQFKIIDYIISTQENQTQQNDYLVFKDIIPPSLIKRVNASIYASIVKSTPVFCEFEHGTIEIIKNITNLFYKPEEVIVTQGDESHSLMFLVTGQLTVQQEMLDGNVVVIGDISEREYFGEVGILFNTERTATVNVKKYANVGQINKRDFFSIMYKFPELLESLRERATSIYNHDPNLKYFLKTVRRVPYFRNLETHVLYTLMYKLKDEHHDAGSILFGEDSKVDRIIFIYEGRVAARFNVFDPVIKKRIRYFNRSEDSERSLTKSLSKQATNTMTKSKINKRRANDNVEFDWCVLGPGSILCWREALFKRMINVKLECKQKTRIFYLKMDDIEEISRSSAVLKNNLELNKSKYSSIDPELKDRIYTTPKIDCFKHLPDRKDPRITNNLIKFKSAIIAAILRKRELKENKIQSVSRLIRKIESIVVAEEKGWKDVARKIENDKIKPEVIENSDLLRHDELEVNILCQFAEITRNIQNMLSTLNEHSNELTKYLEQGKEEDSFLEEQVQAIRSIANSLPP